MNKYQPNVHTRTHMTNSLHKPTYKHTDTDQPKHAQLLHIPLYLEVRGALATGTRESVNQKMYIQTLRFVVQKYALNEGYPKDTF